MPLSSLFQRFRQMTASRPASAPEAMPAVAPSDVEAARVRARRRLIGMAVLVGAGVIGFPWLFETQPRPMSQDVEMVHAGIGGDEGLSVARGAARTATGKVAVADIVPPRGGDRRADGVPARASDGVDERDGRESTGTARAPRESMSTRPPVAAAPPDKTGEKPMARPAAKPADKSDKPTSKADDKPQAKPAAKAAERPDKASDKNSDKSPDKPASRYVVQFGAFSDSAAARSARMKVEKLGIKTYAQQVDTPGGKRIRVRIGPYADKAEADKAQATLRKAGLTAAVLTL